jgi:2-polyprenyl-3-methyl-5-hydroxy-6-metoxy-1,4-benzoquinol methylase
MEKKFGNDPTRAYEAATKAQFLAFAPAFFQAIVALRNLGVLEFLMQNDAGKSEKEIAEFCKLSDYGARILLEAGEQAGALIFDEDKYYLSKTGFFLIRDEITKRNINFINDVCYQGLFFLNESIEEGKPVGLKVFGEHETIYAGLCKLPENVKKSWFEFDHYYSDIAFDEVMEIIFAEKKAKKILDVGGNTGRFAIKCAQFSDSAKITILDLEGQVTVAKENAKNAGLKERIDTVAINLLDHSNGFPKNFDVVWMSQFLDCFAPKDIVELLKRGKKALSSDGFLYIMEPFIDKQKNPQAKLALVGTSLYFTALANGNSRMYHSDEMIEYAKAAGLKLVEEFSEIGDYQTILKLSVLESSVHNKV